MSDTDRFDSMLMNMAQTQRGIEPLLETVFSFLRRKTDFFSGADPKLIEETVLSAVRKQAALSEKDQYMKKQEEEEKRKQREKKRAEEENAKSKKQKLAATAKAAKAAEPEPTPRFEEITDEQATDLETKPQATSAKSDGDEKKDDDDDDGPALVGNGGQTATYVWTQTLQEAQVNFAVPQGTKSRDVDVVITTTKLKVALKGGGATALADGAMFNRVKVDDSFWTLEDGNRICVYLQKENQMEWWKTIIQGDVEINTKKVQPENSKLGDLDADTRQTVEKMMFDQRQKALGLPTSDDMQKQDVLQKFMAQHPEMDFSKAKIN